MTPQPDQSTRQRRVVTGVVAVAALMATGAAVTVTRQAGSSVQVESEVSLATDVTGRMIANMGCSDWANQGPVTQESSAEACVAKCDADPTCMYANYQDQPCPGNGEECAGTGVGHCYSFKTCAYETNSYWNLYVSTNVAMTTCTLGADGENTGCANWKDLQMPPSPPPFVTVTEEDCFRACEANPTCEYGNWQKLENSQCPDKAPAGFPYASQEGKGACYMFSKGPKSEGCTGNKPGIGEENICWNLCTKSTSTTTTTL